MKADYLCMSCEVVECGKVKVLECLKITNQTYSNFGGVVANRICNYAISYM